MWALSFVSVGTDYHVTIPHRESYRLPVLVLAIAFSVIVPILDVQKRLLAEYGVDSS